MNRRLHRLVVALGLVPQPTAAMGQAGSTTGLTAEQVRTAFARSGYAVDQPLTWNWLSPPLTSFHAYDQVGRELFVQVYPPESAPKAPLSHLLPGYGPTVWFQNVALAEAS